MKVLVDGHSYELADYDRVIGANYPPNYLFFFKRIGEKYPRNTGEPHHGTNCQDVIRVLINRVQYLNIQDKCYENDVILRTLREALIFFEIRAAKRHNFVVPKSFMWNNRPEEYTPCIECGHIICEHIRVKESNVITK